MRSFSILFLSTLVKINKTIKMSIKYNIFYKLTTYQILYFVGVINVIKYHYPIDICKILSGLLN